MGIKHSYTATGVNDGTKQVSVDRWNSDHIIDTQLELPVIASPTVPAVDKLAIYGQSRAGRLMLTQMGPSGLDTTLQPHFGGNKIGLWIPPGNGTTVPGILGIGTLSATGTATARNVAATNFATRMLRFGYVSGATAGSLAGVREPQAKYTIGAGNAIGGFNYRLRFIPSNAADVANERFFAGLSASTGSPSNVEPTALVNAIGICQLSTSTNLHVYSAGATAQPAVDLGPDFPGNTRSTEAYEFAMFAGPDGTVDWEVFRLSTGQKVSGTFTALPSATTFLCHQIWKSNNSTALAVGVDICTIYIETDA